MAGEVAPVGIRIFPLSVSEKEWTKTVKHSERLPIERINDFVTFLFGGKTGTALAKNKAERMVCH